ncbi:uncharacterized protein KY384_006644 [Bacidia gigantensis]|uniref:uncharacterized protein n=1 Tax=Bacidia gigantensis TaxID=2732470 RepID=UPI001D03DB83|nr:uncharacterized protein KY384_006644 [Bacidia gigantensis]KAG8528955.1 hypothetical protein KY384_006644 [Bacidia gigantensis]
MHENPLDDTESPSVLRSMEMATYGIPTISSLLVATGELKNAETASKRAADTGVLLLELGLNEPTSERAIEAIARMNFLHAQYQKSGKISNDDMLYTLGILALEPLRWINRYEWRSLTELERCALDTFWKHMGDAMRIEYTKLPSAANGWQDGLHWLDEVQDWSNQYEEAHMIPAGTNKLLADSQFNYLLPTWPVKYRYIYKKIIVVFLGHRLRRSMMYPDSPQIYHRLTNGALEIRKLLLRHLALPRPYILRNRWIESTPDSRERHYALSDYLAHPWYVKPTLMRRWGPRAWISRLFGYRVPGDDGDKYHPQGYIFAEVGPQVFSGKGSKDMDQTRARLNWSKTEAKFGWVSQPNQRGTLDIIWSCVITLALCAWAMLHLNVPAKTDSEVKIFLRKVRWMTLTILAPELVMLFASGQWASAKRSVIDVQRLGRHDWTIVHAFYADSGGFVLHSEDVVPFPVTAKQIHYLVEQGHLAAPTITKKEILDKSKADRLAKVIAGSQAIWLVAEVIA